MQPVKWSLIPPKQKSCTCYSSMEARLGMRTFGLWWCRKGQREALVVSCFLRSCFSNDILQAWGDLHSRPTWQVSRKKGLANAFGFVVVGFGILLFQWRTIWSTNYDLDGWPSSHIENVTSSPSSLSLWESCGVVRGLGVGLSLSHQKSSFWILEVNNRPKEERNASTNLLCTYSWQYWRRLQGRRWKICG